MTLGNGLPQSDRPGGGAPSISNIKESLFTFAWLVEVARDLHEGRLALPKITSPVPEDTRPNPTSEIVSLLRTVVQSHPQALAEGRTALKALKNGDPVVDSEQLRLLLSANTIAEQCRFRNSYLLELIESLKLARSHASSAFDPDKIDVVGGERDRVLRSIELLGRHRAITTSHPTTEREAQILEAYEVLRESLLSTSLRGNTFLNLQPQGSTRAIDCEPQSVMSVIDALVGEHGTLGFVSESSAAVGTVSQGGALDLTTRHDQDELETRLLTISVAAQAAQDQRGAHPLFLALGSVCWSAPGDSSTDRRAPLVLVPVDLVRTDAATPFRLVFRGDSIESNAPFIRRMREEHEIELPSVHSIEGISQYFEDVAEAVSSVGFSVDRSSVALALFRSSALMHKDLDPDEWSEDKKPWRHPVVSAVLGAGFDAGGPTVPQGATPDEMQYLGCDAAQEAVLSYVSSGRSAVLIGPPGTGKSFTIAEFLCRVVAQGKTALFVAAKPAALEVVERRLKALGLEDLVLSVPRHDITKRTIFEELRRTVAQGEPKVPGDKGIAALYRTIRTRLDSHLKRSTQVDSVSGCSPIEIAREIAVSGAPAPGLQGLECISHLEWKKIREELRAVEAWIRRYGAPANHPWANSSLIESTPDTVRGVADTLRQSHDMVLRLEPSLRRMSVLLGLPRECAVSKVTSIAELVVTQLQSLEGLSIPFGEVAIGDPRLHTHAQELSAVLDSSDRCREIVGRYGDRVADSTWMRSVVGLSEQAKGLTKGFFRYFTPSYHRWRRETNSLFLSGRGLSDTDRVAVVSDVSEVQGLRDRWESSRALIGEIFPAAVMGQPWDRHSPGLVALVRTSIRLHGALREAGSTTVDVLPLHGELRQVAGEVAQHGASLVPKIRSLSKLSGVSVEHFTECGIEQCSARLHRLIVTASRLPEIAEFNGYANRLSAASGVSLLPVLRQWKENASDLPGAFHSAWLKAHLDRLVREWPELIKSGEEIEQLSQKLSTVESSLLPLNRGMLAARHWRSLPRIDTGGQVGFFAREIAKRARNCSVQDLFHQSGDVMRAVKPIILMTPKAVAEFLPQNASFDFYVGDEASQKELSDALGGLLRTKHALVVGDDKQMAPSHFFESKSGSSISLLDRFSAAGAERFMLTASYRFQEPSLVACSNELFYGGKLRVFPPPAVTREARGLIYQYEDLPYDGEGINQAEAKKVAARVIEHAQQSPGLSLGVAALSQEQSVSILREVEKLRRANPKVESFFSAHPDTPFFVKNLENVQGDERDVMLISTAYGKSKNGKLYMRFGMINQPGGDRALNVLFTRARIRCELFTALDPDTLPVTNDSSVGVRALWDFLQFAKHGILPSATQGVKVGSSIQTAIQGVLEQRGYTVHAQVGIESCPVSLAVVHPQDGKRYALGILVDGELGEKTGGVRDRYQILPESLARLGWRIYNCSALGWALNREGELARLCQAVERAVVAKPNDTSSVVRPPTYVVSRVQNGGIEPGRGVEYEFSDPAYPKDVDSFSELSTQRRNKIIREIVEVEGPIHQRELYLRLRDIAEIERESASDREALQAAVDSVDTISGLIRKGEFIYGERAEIQVRDRSALTPSRKKIEYIAPEEIECATVEVVTNAWGIRRSEIPEEACRLLGYKSVPAGAEEIIGGIVSELCTRGEILEREGRVFVR